MRRKKPDTKILRINKGCAYFPCHSGLEDCTFCFCPFYPCPNDKLGSYIFSRKTKQKIWSCKGCSWIHKKNVVDKLLLTIRNGNIKMPQEAAKLRTRKVGIIILGHGSNLKKANYLVRRVATEIKHRSGLAIVEPAYLQLCKPSLQEAINKIAQKGCRKIIIVPFFLFIGNHVSRDIPHVIEQEAKIHKGVEFVYTRNLGQDQRIDDIVMDRVREAIRWREY